MYVVAERRCELGCNRPDSEIQSVVFTLAKMLEAGLSSLTRAGNMRGDHFSRIRSLRLLKSMAQFWARMLICLAVASGTAQARNEERAFTVLDAVSAEWYVDVLLGVPVLGAMAEESLNLKVVAYSPDGSRAVFLTRKGNLENETTDYILHLVTLEDKNVEHKELVRLGSHSNGPAISALRWISSDRIGFAGESPNGMSQVMSVDIKGRLVEHTKSEQRGLGFDISESGIVVFGVAAPDDAPIRAEGYTVNGDTLHDIVGIEKIDWRRKTDYFIKNHGGVRRLNNVSNATSSFPPFISISPSGRYAVVASSPELVPKEWAKYPLLVKAEAGAAVHPLHAKLVLVDLESDERYELSGAPMAYPTNRTQLVWDEANSRLFLIDQFVGPEQAVGLEEFSESFRPATLEYSLATKRLVRLVDISPKPAVYSNRVIADSARVSVESGNLEIVRGTTRFDYSISSEGWYDEGAIPAQKKRFTLFVDQSVERPAQMYCEVVGTARRIPIGKINGHFKNQLNPAVHYQWEDEAGRSWEAGLILPKESEQRESLPLVIQTHSFSPHEFVITGPRGSAAGFSAQALASAGFAVLNMGRQRHDIIWSDEEFVVQAEGYRSAIKALSKEGTINPNRVGIAAWSRAGYWLQYALALEKRLFTTAIASDASSFGLYRYLLFHNWPSMYQRDFLTQKRGELLGVDVSSWRASNPVTRVKAFQTPLLISHYGQSFPSWWEPYVAMKEAGEPVEYFILRNASHDPIQPQHRLLLQSLTVDWFRFWLQDYEDQDPRKAEQYSRWRKLRGGLEVGNAGL